MEHEEYIKRRDELYQIRNDSFDSFDKSILTVTGAALALSIAFLDKIGSPFSVKTFCLICITWICFFLVFVFNITSFYFSRKNMDRKIGELDVNYQDQLKGGGKVKEHIEKDFWYKKATLFCNNMVLIVFIISFFTFSWYIIEIQINNYEINIRGK